MKTAATSDPQDYRARPGRWLLIALALSLGLHCALLLIRTGDEGPSTAPDDLIVSLQTIARAPSPEPADQAERQEPINEAEMPQALQPEPEVPSMTASSASDTDAEPGESTEDAPDSTPGAPDDIPITTRLLSSVRESLGQPTIPAAGDAITPARIPSLPDAPGWIDQFVGQVDGRVEQWTNGDGSIESRVVTASGQVICGRAQAPTTADIFNPQFATNIMLFRDCGRIRPHPADLSDPRLRTPRP